MLTLQVVIGRLYEMLLKAYFMASREHMPLQLNRYFNTYSFLPPFRECGGSTGETYF
jgi:hypothetical protein